MKFLIKIFLNLCLLSLNSNSQNPKTATFERYQKERQFKGVQFGATLDNISKSLQLSSGSPFYNYGINNADYLFYASHKFNSGTISFNPDGKMFQVTLNTMRPTPLLNEYLALKRSLIHIFGENDKEYFINNSESMNATWSGKNLDIVISYSPLDKVRRNNAQISLTVNDRIFGNFKWGEMGKKRRDDDANKIPKI